MKSSFVWRYANAREGKFQFRLRQDNPAIGPDGEIYVAWKPNSAAEIHIAVDTDRLNSGSGFSEPFTVASGAGVVQGFSAFRNLPVLDVDRNVDDNGRHRLYVTWTADPISVGSGIIVSSATSDNLANWTRVTVDPMSTTTDRLSWVDVDQSTGSVNVIYYQVPGEFNNNSAGIHAVISTSFDGGQSFSPTIRLSKMPTAMGGIEVGGIGMPLLEYIGLAVHNGTLHGLWADRRDGGPDFEAYAASASFHSVSGDNVLEITGDDGGVATNDTIVLSRNALNSNYLDVTVNGIRQYRGLLASVQLIEIELKLGNDIIQLDADIDAAFVIRGGAGTDEVKLVGNGASALRSFRFEGEAGDDDLTIDFRNGDALPVPGFDFNFIGGDGQDDTKVIEVGGAERTAWFVNTLTDAVDLVPGGRPDSNANLDDQITLRAAIQVANQASARTSIFLPTDLSADYFGHRPR